jgi:hypothetical protein
LRFLEAAAFFPAATRFVDFRAVDFLAVDVVRAADVFEVVVRPGVRLLPVAVRVSAGRVGDGAVSAPIGPPTGIAAGLERGTGRSQAGVSGCQDGSWDGSGAAGASSVSRSPVWVGSGPAPLSVPSVGHSRCSRSDVDMCVLPPRVVVSPPLPERDGFEAF